MSKLKMTVARFVVDKFFSSEVKGLKESYYHAEKSKVERELRSLENSLTNMQREYQNLQQQKFIETVNADLSKHHSQEKEQSKSKENTKDPFADWEV